MNPNATYTIGELARLANVTTRTIRYYVSKELLPPPRGGGRAASYGDSHRRRLELIKLLKAEFLPLDEIKMLLGSLDDHAVDRLLREHRPLASVPAPDTAKEYLQTLLLPESKSSPLLRQTAARAAHSAPPPARQPGGRGSDRAPDKGAPTASHRSAPAISWRRFAIHPDLELHVRQPITDSRLDTHFDQFLADLERVIKELCL